jgi:hypothetical protein
MLKSKTIIRDRDTTLSWARQWKETEKKKGWLCRKRSALLLLQCHIPMRRRRRSQQQQQQQQQWNASTRMPGRGSSLRHGVISESYQYSNNNKQQQQEQQEEEEDEDEAAWPKTLTCRARASRECSEAAAVQALEEVVVVAMRSRLRCADSTDGNRKRPRGIFCCVSPRHRRPRGLGKLAIAIATTEQVAGTLLLEAEAEAAAPAAPARRSSR